MTSISDLKTDGIGGPLQVRILRKWKHDVRQYETWYLAVDRFIRDCTKAGGESFVLLILTDESGSELAINLWKECITNPDKFNRDSLHPPPATTVVAVTNLKPSIYNGVLRYGSSHATHIYVNPDIPETIALINLFTGPSRPAPPLSGTPSTLYDMKTKNRSDLLASIKEFHYQNSWFQPICPICKDPIFKRGESWYCSAHGLIEKPTYMYKLTVTITDATNTISALISETSCQKLLKSSLENFISNNPHINRNTLPPIITNHKKQTKKMSIQMLRASTPDNIRFIIIDIEDPTTRAQTYVPATPAQPQMTRMQPSDTTPEPSTPVQHVARALTYDPTESTPRKNAKRTAKQ
ncbi:unnamed protein product [Lactuca virosa]|uniref:Replication factor A C-terminal domain-containing protein n=1 Tax=Lactuca virosa TaxID=75947 RepID=A0AAU9PFH0_9ASTR|nr:unnamed protein product [Lactuca virosa]